MVASKPTGNQIAFLIVAAWLLMVPLSRFLERTLGLPPMVEAAFDRYFSVLCPALLFMAVPPIRRACIAALRAPVGPHRPEVAIVTLLHPLHFFAFAGACTLYWHGVGGASSLQHHLSQMDSGAHAMLAATHPVALASDLLFAVALGPVVEELLFRRFLYRAWEARHGWLPAMLAGAALFGMLHANFLPSFLAAIVFTCAYRRTGSLRAAIVVHAAGNLAIEYPLLGRFVWPRDLVDAGDLHRWAWHIAALVLVAVLCPLYAWMSRDRRDAPMILDAAHAALPR